MAAQQRVYNTRVFFNALSVISGKNTHNFMIKFILEMYFCNIFGNTFSETVGYALEL